MNGVKKFFEFSREKDRVNDILEKKVVLCNKMINPFVNHNFEKESYLLFVKENNFQVNFSVKKDVYFSLEIGDNLNIFYRECSFRNKFKEYHLEKVEKIYSIE